MLFTRNHGYTWRAIGLCLLALSVSSTGGVTHTADNSERWRDFGALMLYRLGTGRRPSVEWFDPDLRVANPDSRDAVRAAETTLQHAFNGYGHDAIALHGRIPLDTHPQCILGLCLAEQFPDTRLGTWGYRQFAMCIEQSFLAAMPIADGAWSDRLEEVLLVVDKTRAGSLGRGPFAPTETPYLYLYLIHNGGSEDIRSKAREHLAQSLWEDYGLEPGLGQYRALMDQGDRTDGLCLEVAAQLERIGARRGAKRIYAQMLKGTECVDQARQAFERLGRILLLESRHKETVAAWKLLSQRFPEAEHVALDTKNLLDYSPERRAETSRRLVAELGRLKNTSQSLRLCRSLSALWDTEEAPEKWRAVVDGAEPGSPTEKLCRVFHARAMLDVGKADAAALAIRGLTDSSPPVVRAQSLATSAEISRAKGQWKESVRLYSRALQINRPTYLPDWCKGLLRLHSSQVDAPMAELQMQGRFLKACNELIDGDYTAAMDGFDHVATDLALLPASLQHTLPCALMLASLGAKDYAEAEVWGYRAIEAHCRANRDDDESKDLLAKIHDLDVTICQALAQARDHKTDTSVDSTGLRNAIRISEVGMALDLLATHTDPMRGGVQQLYVRAKKRHTARVLTTEYYYIRQLSAESSATGPSSCCEALLFAAHTLSESPVDRIREDFASLARDAEDTDAWLCRFAMFAQEIERLDLAMNALNAVTGVQASPAYVGAWEAIAERYAEASNHRKAIEAYQRVAAHSREPNKIQAVLLKVVDIYTGNLKDYDKAIQECEGLVTRYPDSPVTGQVEFAIGRLAYQKGDYAGAVGQLDGFLRRYPKAPQIGQAMMLAGLSRMAEGNTQEAIGRFTEVIQRYPDDELAARSKFLIGYAQVSNQQYAMATETFKQLIEQFPQSQYVSQAEKLIGRLRKVSR